MSQKCKVHFASGDTAKIPGEPGAALYNFFRAWLEGQTEQNGWIGKVDDEEVVINFHLVERMELTGNGLSKTMTDAVDADEAIERRGRPGP
jgi:hypothetical protein